MGNFIGWHGTTNRNAEKILTSGFSFKPYIVGKPNQRLPNDLGVGVYFYTKFLDNEGEIIARKYVEKYKSKTLKRQGSEVCVLNVNIQYNEDELIDLNEEDTRADFILLHAKFEKAIIKEMEIIQKGPILDRANSDGLVIEMLHEEAKKRGKPFNIVKCDTFTEFEYRSRQSKNGCELCVRDLELIEILEMGKKK